MTTEILIYTDGSSHHNGKPNCYAGWSCVFYLGGKMYVRYGHLTAPSSNNRGEIMGVLFAIDMLRDKPWALKFHSDSQYVVKSINEWRQKWKKTNYDGVKNADLLVPLFNSWDAHGNAKIEWVRGHIGVKGNEIADEFAGYASSNTKLEKADERVNILMVEPDWKPKHG
jgi:ribonuclease HI